MAKKKAAAEGEEAKGGKGKTLAMGAVLAVGLLGGLKGFVLSGGAKAAGATGVSTTTTTKPGPVVTLDPITVNIAGDRFLKVGLGQRPDQGLRPGARPHHRDLRRPHLRRPGQARRPGGGQGRAGQEARGGLPRRG
jgi:hypothetical protein